MTRLLVLGGDAAGMTAALHVRRAQPDWDVVVLERSPYTSYSMCGLPFYVAGDIDDPQELVARTPEQLRAEGVDVRTRNEAIAIDASARSVRVRDLSSPALPGAAGGTPAFPEHDEAYDLLLVATGAHPELPGIPGLRQFGHVVHTLDEAERLRRALEAHREIHRVVVVGTGYIGLEIAEALIARGLSATLVDRSLQVMKSLDEDMAVHVQRRVEAAGFDVRLGETLVEIRGEPDADCCHEVVTDRATYEADTVVVALGGRPNVRMAAEAGCAVGTSGGLVVDGRMRTTVAGIWAAGDCVESTDLVAGLKVNVQLGTHANKQGKVAGLDIAAHPGEGAAVFPGVVGTAVTRVVDLEIGRTGLNEADAVRAGQPYAATSFTGTARAGYMPDPGVVHVKMLAEPETGRVLGCQLVGTGNVAKRIDVAAMWCQLRVPVQTAQLLDLSYAPPYGGVWDLLQVAARRLTKKLGLSPQL